MSQPNLPQLKKSKEILTQAYGEQLIDLILFGSTARGDDSEQSDIDLLVLLDKPFDYWNELRKTFDLLYPLQFEGGKYISAKPALNSDYQSGKTNLYKNIKRDGISIR